MNVWLVTIGEPVPVDESFTDRLHRTGQLAAFLASQGHSVTWWTSTFDHFSKKHHFDSDTVVFPEESLRIMLLHGCGYSSNMSFSRIKDQRQIAAKFALQSRNQTQKPDIILSSLPTIELCDEVVNYGKEQRVPVVLDMRDMWPDILVDSIPGPARWLARLVLSPMFKQAARACRGADAITGITEDFVDWGVAKAGRERIAVDQSFPFAYVTNPLAPERIAQAQEYWDQQGIPKCPEDFVVCFFGTISHQLDVNTLIKAARLLKSRMQPVKFVICGTGDTLEQHRQAAEDCTNMLFPGWMNAAQIKVLMQRSSLGLDPMPDRYDFLATINNKALEYISAGLPVVSSPKAGVLYRLLKENDCGVSHDMGDSEALADILEGLVVDKQRLRQLSENASRLFESTFTLERVCTNLENYLLEIVSRTSNTNIND